MSTKSYQPDTKSRLEAHRKRLERRSEESKMRILNSVDYLRDESIEIAKGEALSALTDRSPITALLLRKLLGIKRGTAARTRIVQVDDERSQEGDARELSRTPRLPQSRPTALQPSLIDRIQTSPSWASLLEDVVLPVGIAVGGSLLFAGTLRGVGSGIRGIARGLLGGFGKILLK